MHGTFATFLRVSVLPLDSLPSSCSVTFTYYRYRFSDNNAGKWNNLMQITHTWSPDAYKWANSSPLIKSLTLLITSIIIAFGTISRVVLVTIRIYESTKLRMVSTCLSSIGSSEVVDGSPCSCNNAQNVFINFKLHTQTDRHNNRQKINKYTKNKTNGTEQSCENCLIKWCDKTLQTKPFCNRFFKLFYLYKMKRQKEVEDFWCYIKVSNDKLYLKGDFIFATQYFLLFISSFDFFF